MNFLKKNFKKLILVASLMLGSTAIYKIATQCKLDGSSVCYSKKLEHFLIEEDASIRVQVENESLGEYLINTWNELHPDNMGAIEAVVQEPLSLTHLADKFETDVLITSLNNAAYVLDEVFDLGKSIEKPILTYSSSALEDAINERGNFFVPNSVSGWTFIYNKTLLEELGVDLGEKTSFLPDAFSSWEKLVELDELVYEKLDILFPLSFQDQYSFYPFLTSGKWHLNFTNVGNDAGFSHAEFLRGLNLIDFFSQHNLRKETLSADELPWEYNIAFFERRTPFSLMSDWMNLEYFQAKTQDEYVIAPLPTFENNQLRTKGNVDGYLVNKQTAYPSASAEAIRILRSADAFKFYESSDGKTFAYHRDHIANLEGDANDINLVYALNFVDPDPVMVLEDAPHILARSFLYEVNFMDELKALYDGKKAALDVQESLVQIHRAWIQEKLNDKGE